MHPIENTLISEFVCSRTANSEVDEFFYLKKKKKLDKKYYRGPESGLHLRATCYRQMFLACPPVPKYPEAASQTIDLKA